MANGDDTPSPPVSAPELAALPPGKKRYTVRNKEGQAVTVIGPAENADPERIKQMARAEFARRTRVDLGDLPDVPSGFAHGVVKGLAGAAAPLAQATQAEMGEIPSAPGEKQTSQILERQLGMGPAPTSGLGRMAERSGEFLANPSTWIGPGGPIMKAASAITGGIGSFLGERFGEKYGHPALGEFAGGGLGGGVTGVLAPRGLPQRVPGSIRRATTEQAVRGESKAAYQELGMLQYNMTEQQAGQIKQAIVAELQRSDPLEPQRPLFRRENAPGVFKDLDMLDKPSAMPGSAFGGPGVVRQSGITVNDVERVRQFLAGTRMNGGAEAVAATHAIEAIDDYLLNLPGVAGITERARKNWAAYKRGQIVEETIAAAKRRADVTGTGANFDNVLRQEFRRRIREKPKVFGAFSEFEQQQIDKILDPGNTVNFARWLSRMGPRHYLTAGVAGLGAKEVSAGLASAGATAYTHDPLYILGTLAAGEAAHHVAEHAQLGRARRVAEFTRARSPAGGYYTPRPPPSRTTTGIAGAGRALGATALSPETTERLELPEIVVRPPQ
jgi:hypothetical protein